MQASLEELPSSIATAPSPVLFQAIDVKLCEILFLTTSLLGSQSDVGYSSMKEDGQANQKPKSSSQKDLPTAIKGKFLSSLSFKLGKSKGDGITI